MTSEGAFMKLVLCNDFYHRGDVIARGLSDIDGLDYIFDMRNFSPAQLDGCECVILCKDDEISHEDRGGWMTGEFFAKLEDAVAGGMKLIALHAGITSCRRHPRMKALIGCAFAHHPEQCAVECVPFHGHRLTDGVPPFRETDEHYFIDLTARDAEIFMTSHSKHGEQPAGYTRRHGNGTVCVLTPGHNVEVFQNPSYKRLIKNVIEGQA